MIWNRNNKKNKNPSADYIEERQHMIGRKMNFASSEAYKLLRTNLLFSFADDENKRIIGITSAVKGEGKSLTSINLAYSMAETGKKILLIECDLRLPNIAKRLNIPAVPGLSNLLVGMSSANDAIQKSVLLETLDIMPAGDIPPNAAELLESSRMGYTLDKLSEYYDVILLDLPPVTAVSDALIASKLTTGMILVVKEGYATKSALAETMRQMKYVNAHLLGFVFNGVDQSTRTYQKHYKKYYGYENYGYEHAKSNLNSLNGTEK